MEATTYGSLLSSGRDDSSETFSDSDPRTANVSPLDQEAEDAEGDDLRVEFIDATKDASDKSEGSDSWLEDLLRDPEYETDEKDPEDLGSHISEQDEDAVKYDDISDSDEETSKAVQNDIDKQSDGHGQSDSEESDSEDQDGEHLEKQLELAEFLSLRDSSRAGVSRSSTLVPSRAAYASTNSSVKEQQSEDTSLKRSRRHSSTSTVVPSKRNKPSLTLEEENMQLKLKLAEYVAGSHGPLTDLRQLIDDAREKASSAERRAAENERRLEAIDELPI
ncbi:hypothetical protein EDB81DRAFT_763901 [Dactylonectria macrodidyma]|uniref:Uncharacterized protein n=1 Tax=Dactylonectria macrodidyma TaxID=307937 RepID=A0A9P9E5Y2_9HYPO|nr:hypothetical protein EDB81DRAFT_763901 [Dactylonectria macrodidyma]